MKNILLRVLSRLLRNDIGKIEAQNFFEKLHSFGILGMNYGAGDKLETSGEKNALRYITKKLSNRPVIFDVGANKGEYVLSLYALIPEACIYAFEPSAKIFEELKRNLEGKDVNLYQLGISEYPGQVTLYSTPEISELSSIYNRRLEHAGLTLGQRENIELATIDDFCATYNIGFIDFLKMDIEGHELSALKGASRMLRTKKIHFIQFEFGGTNVDSRTYFQDFWYLLHQDYIIYRIVKDGLVKISQYKETLEIFTTINYLAELKR